MQHEVTIHNLQQKRSKAAAAGVEVFTAPICIPVAVEASSNFYILLRIQLLLLY